MLTSVCQVFVSEISTQRMSGQRGSQEYITALRTSLDAVVHLLTELGTVCPLMSTRLHMSDELVPLLIKHLV